jgi:hypothetical protein
MFVDKWPMPLILLDDDLREEQCCGSGMFIPDPTFFHPGSRIRTVSIPDPGSSSKNLSILTPKKAKKWFLSSEKYDPVVHPGSRILMLTFSHPGSRIRIRNTGEEEIILIGIREQPRSHYISTDVREGRS